MFTRQQWPPSSFCGTGTMLSPAWLGTGTLPVPLLPRRTHQADTPDAGVDPRAHRGVSGLLAEEEVEFVVVPLAAVGDELGADEGRVCKGTGRCRQPGGTPGPPLSCSGVGTPARSLQRSSAGGVHAGWWEASPCHPSARAPPVLTAPPLRSRPRQLPGPAGPSHLLRSVYSAAALGPGVLHGGRRSARGH